MQFVQPVSYTNFIFISFYSSITYAEYIANGQFKGWVCNWGVACSMQNLDAVKSGSSYYTINRALLHFDTTGLALGGGIDWCKLNIHWKSEPAAASYRILESRHSGSYVQTSDWDQHKLNIETNEYNDYHGSPINVSLGAYHSKTLDAETILPNVQSGNFTLSLIEERDFDDTPPTAGFMQSKHYYGDFYTTEQSDTDKDPYIEIQLIGVTEAATKIKDAKLIIKNSKVTIL